MSLSDVVGLVGAALMLSAYAAVALDKLHATGGPALSMNLAGALLVLFSLFYDFNLSAAILETAWALVALVGLVRLALKKAELGP